MAKCCQSAMARYAASSKSTASAGAGGDGEKRRFRALGDNSSFAAILPTVCRERARRPLNARESELAGTPSQAENARSE